MNNIFGGGGNSGNLELLRRSFHPFSSVGENVEITEKYRAKCGNVVQISAVMEFKNDIAEYQTLATLAIPPKILIDFNTARPAGSPMFVFDDGRIQSRAKLSGSSSAR